MPLLGESLLLSDDLLLGEGATPASGLFTEGVSQSLSPWYDAAGSWQNLAAALSAMFEPIAELVMPIGSPDEPDSYTPGWSVLLDPANCPTAFLPYLACFNGTVVAPGTADADARAIINAESGFARGTLQAIRSAVERAQATPDPTRYAIVERTGTGGPDPYHFLVAIDETSLTTQGDPTQLIANVTAVKPAGLQFTVVPFAAPLVSEYTRLFSAITTELSAAQIADVT